MQAGLANDYSRPQTNKYFTGQASLPQPCSSKQQDVYSTPSEVGKLQRVNGTCTPQQAAEAAAEDVLKNRKNMLSTVRNVFFVGFQTNKVRHWSTQMPCVLSLLLILSRWETRGICLRFFPTSLGLEREFLRLCFIPWYKREVGGKSQVTPFSKAQCFLVKQYFSLDSGQLSAERLCCYTTEARILLVII